MKLWSEKKGSAVKVFCEGDIDEHTVYEIRTYIDRLAVRGITSLELCMKYVDFMDSTGVGMLLGRYKKLTKMNVPLYVSEVNAQVDKVFKLSGIYSVIPLVR